MNNTNMTALVSAFARCYHAKNSKTKIYDDPFADKILTESEYCNISDNMANGIPFFNPNFVGSKEEALHWIVNNQIGPSVLARSAFNKKALENAIKLGCRQYLLFGAGYDTSAIGQSIKCYEIDRAEVIADKKQRLNNHNIDCSNIEHIACDFTQKDWFDEIDKSSYSRDMLSFNSLLGLSYYLTPTEFSETVNTISKNICEGSCILFDFQTKEESKEAEINERLAEGADEKMKSRYSYAEIKSIVEKSNMQIYEYLDDEEMTKQFFSKYNSVNQGMEIIAPKGIAYLLAVK